LCQHAYTTLEPGNPLGLLQEALELTKEFEPVERRLRRARKEGLLSSDYLGEQIDEAEKAQVISKAEARNMRSYHEKVLALLAVDDFDPSELVRQSPENDAPAVPAKKTARPTRKTTKKKAVRKKKAAKKKA
jgi:acyl-CoA dehydrogenase